MGKIYINVEDTGETAKIGTEITDVSVSEFVIGVSSAVAEVVEEGFKNMIWTDIEASKEHILGIVTDDIKNTALNILKQNEEKEGK